MIVIVNFGSQTCHLISRRLRDLGVETVLVEPEEAVQEVARLQPQGIILSGGPTSVYADYAPTISKKIFSVGVPILGICYGWQLTAHLLSGTVESGKKEYGPTVARVVQHSELLDSITDQTFSVWMSHGDEVTKIPDGFEIMLSSPDVRAAGVQNTDKQIFGVQFHPELDHTEHGTQLLQNFAVLCGETIQPKVLDYTEIVAKIKAQVPAGDEVIALAAVSGGVDSAVASALVAKAIGNRFVPVYCDTGLMRPGTTEQVKKIFDEILGVPAVIVDCKDRFLSALSGVTDADEKRKIIGKLFIDEFETVLEQYPTAQFLVQGTLYSDFVESSGSRGSSQIRRHHNVAGLPEKMKLQLLEPLKQYYKDEGRALGKQLGLPQAVIQQQPFPGPGQAIRILGEVTPARLAIQQQADSILLDILKETGWYEKVFQSFTVLTNTESTGVKGDERFTGEVVAVRIYDSNDIMSAGWTHLPYEVLQMISTRIVNEVPSISRVVYDITTKPPATMEWE